jgi:AcrR family transcriptional regulator
MRKDAEANRDRLILTARRIMQDLGGDVPVERICRDAQITRGTFYRNFADRAALYEAVLERELAEMLRELEEPSADPLRFLRLLARMMVVYDRFLSALPDMDDFRNDGESDAKIIAAIAPSLASAKAAGEIDPTISGEDVLLATRMIGRDWRLDRQPTFEAALERRLALMLRGLRRH